ncbi:oligosaccharide flippase family protein [Acidimangrovimonas pyrenivorans]|uniref:Oligosaccharide flippase family protein n=1 Tax=Acidimangrovimonas pyrenivorans TaxID=2030798 RepID=A0ABV7ABJ8_9RHOB
MSNKTSSPAPRRKSGTVGDGIWTMMERVISQGTQLAIFVAAARLLSPAEFGVFALVSTCAILLLRVAEVSWAPYIMSWSGDDTVPRQVVMIALYAGVAMGAVGGLAGALLPALGFGAQTGHLVMLFALWVLLATVSSAQKGMMIWQDRLRASAAAEITGDVVGMAVALAFLFSGWGVFALAFGRLAFQSTHLVLSFAFTRRAPLPGMEATALRDLIAYSRQNFTSRIIANLRLYVATFVIGGFLGPAAVGYYRAAARLVGAVAEVIGQPAHVLAWSLFRQVRDAHEGSTTGFQTQAKLYFTALFALGVPVFVWLGVMGEDLIRGLLGEKWLPALPVVAVLALSRALQLPGPAVEPIMSLAGQVRRLPLFTLFGLVLSVAATTAGATFGLLAVAWSQVVVSAVMAVASARLLQRHAGLSWPGILYSMRRIVVPLLLGAAVILLLREFPAFEQLPALVRAFGAVVPALAIYLVALAVAEPRLRALARSRLRRRQGGARS